MSNPGQVETATVTAQRLGPSNVAIPECFIDIYPFEGGPYTFSGGQIINCRTMKNIKGGPGEFIIQIAPETLGNNLSWGQILTPMSSVIIGMRRNTHATIVMIGVITEIEEDQIWKAGKPVTRVITVRGQDMAIFFGMQDYYSLFFLASFGAKSAGNGVSFADVAAGIFSGNPGFVAQSWYNSIMVDGVFSTTVLPYRQSGPVLSALFASEFDMIPFKIPTGEYFLGVNGSWLDKFNLILPFPFYEFFITTAPSGTYPAATGGMPLATFGLGANVTSIPQVIGRVNPVPMLVTSLKNGTPSFDSMDVSKWIDLPSFDTEDLNFISSSIAFSEKSVFNFFNINCPYMLGLNGGSNSNRQFPIFNYASSADRASMNRYGYRPLEMNVNWFSDLNGAGAKAPNAPQNNLEAYAALIGQVAGYYEATPLMAMADVRLVLRPDIQIGTKFSYTPYRSGEVWDFYVEGVSHEFNFGGESSTRLTLTRGLPHSVYSDSGANGKLFGVYTGNVQRVGGEYITSSSAPPLQPVSIAAFNAWMLQLSKYYVTPQATSVPASGSP